MSPWLRRLLARCGLAKVSASDAVAASWGSDRGEYEAMSAGDFDAVVDRAIERALPLAKPEPGSAHERAEYSGHGKPGGVQ